MLIHQQFDGADPSYFVESVPCTFSEVLGMEMQINVRTEEEQNRFIQQQIDQYPSLQHTFDAVTQKNGQWECSLELTIKQKNDNEYDFLSVEGEPCFKLKIHQVDSSRVPALLLLDSEGDVDWLILVERTEDPGSFVFEIPFDKEMVMVNGDSFLIMIAYWPIEDTEIMETRGVVDLIPTKAYQLFHIDFFPETGITDIRPFPDPKREAEAYKNYWIALQASMEDPVLMMFHGFGGKIEKSLKNLIKDTSTMTALSEKYGRRMIGFDHPSITDSPAKNADHFFEFFKPGVFPEGIPSFAMDMLTRSRGSIVAREIIEAPHPDFAVPFKVAKLVMLAGPNQATPSAVRTNLIRTGLIWLNISKQRQEIASSPSNIEWEDDTELDEELITEMIRMSSVASVRGIMASEDDREAVGFCPGLRALAPTSDYIKGLNLERGVVPEGTEYYAINVQFDPMSLEGLSEKRKWKLARRIRRSFGEILTDGVVPTFGGHGVDESHELVKTQQAFRDLFKEIHMIGPGATHHESLFLNEDLKRKLVRFLTQ